MSQVADRTITARCHCGKTAFRMATDMPAQLTRCSYSFCAKQGSLRADCTPDQFQ